MAVRYSLSYYELLVIIIASFRYQEKLLKLSKTSNCALVGEWIKSTTNYLYWCAASAADGDDIVKHWKSLMNHIFNVHEDCYHDNLSQDQRRKKWFSPGIHFDKFYN